MRRKTGTAAPRSAWADHAVALALGVLLWAAVPTPAAMAQEWNDSTTLSLVRRGIRAREESRPDSDLVSYRTRAHGFVFFLAQVGSGLTETPRLIKADELEVEVYWRAPATSKQVILAWRDGRWLPTDINYHRDHLGIVTNNFGDLIRIGEGDEVRDVLHPLAAGGPGWYEYRLRDSLRIQVRSGTLQLHEIEVRPRQADRPGVIGTLSLDAATGDLVRFRFSFSPAAYLDHSLEDISILLENARVEQRWWLPWRQEIEIRRRLTWFDFPARSIIRGRWEIGDYDVNVALPQAPLRGPAIGGLRRPAPDSSTWSTPLAVAVRDAARAVEQRDLDQVRDEVERLAVGRLTGTTPRLRPGVSSLSDLARVNRVQGLALGFGVALPLSGSVALRPRVAFGTSDERLVGDLTAVWRHGATAVAVDGGRRLRDLSDHPVVSPVVNSLLSQEGGRDLGDYVLLDRAGITLSRIPTGALAFTLGGSVERGHSVEAEAHPARGRYRPNPPLGERTMGVGRLDLEYAVSTLERDRTAKIGLELEAGVGDQQYARAVLRADLLKPLGPGGALLRIEAGGGTAHLPAYRSFAIGGWGTLLGEPFRAFGGRRYTLAHLEYGFKAPFPALPLGAFVSTGREITVAPFIAAGWADGGIPGVPWRPAREIRPVAGVALEWFHRLVRVETGVSLRTGQVGVSVDVNREWWEIL